jgi:hypothetical protein
MIASGKGEIYIPNARRQLSNNEIAYIVTNETAKNGAAKRGCIAPRLATGQRYRSMTLMSHLQIRMARSAHSHAIAAGPPKPCGVSIAHCNLSNQNKIYHKKSEPDKIRVA